MKNTLISYSTGKASTSCNVPKFNTARGERRAIMESHDTCFDRRILSEFKSQRLRNERLLTFPACRVDYSIPLQLKIFSTFWHLSSPQRLFQLQTNETISISSPKVFPRMGVSACYQHAVCTCGK